MASKRNAYIDLPSDLAPDSPDFLATLNDRLRRLSTASGTDKAAVTKIFAELMSTAPSGPPDSTGIRLDVTSFGALQDCTPTNPGTDNTPFFQAAVNFLAAAGGGQVWVPNRPVSAGAKYRLGDAAGHAYAVNINTGGVSILGETTPVHYSGAGDLFHISTSQPWFEVDGLFMSGESIPGTWAVHTIAGLPSGPIPTKVNNNYIHDFGGYVVGAVPTSHPLVNPPSGGAVLIESDSNMFTCTRNVVLGGCDGVRVLAPIDDSRIEGNGIFVNGWCVYLSNTVGSASELVRHNNLFGTAGAFHCDGGGQVYVEHNECEVIGGTIAYINVTGGGSGYTTPPPVSMLGLGSAVARLTGGSVSSIYVTGSSWGYGGAATVTNGSTAATLVSSIGATTYYLYASVGSPLPITIGGVTYSVTACVPATGAITLSAPYAGSSADRVAWSGTPVVTIGPPPSGVTATATAVLTPPSPANDSYAAFDFVSAQMFVVRENSCGMHGIGAYCYHVGGAVLNSTFAFNWAGQFQNYGWLIDVPATGCLFLNNRYPLGDPANSASAKLYSRQHYGIIHAGNAGLGMLTDSPEAYLHVKAVNVDNVLMLGDSLASGHVSTVFLWDPVGDYANGKLIIETKKVGTGYGQLALQPNGGPVGIGLAVPTSLYTLTVAGRMLIGTTADGTLVRLTGLAGFAYDYVIDTQSAAGLSILSQRAGALPVLIDSLGNVTLRSLTLSGSVLSVVYGGTGQATLAANGVVIGQGTAGVNVTAPGTSGQVLTSNGAGVDPTFQASPGGAPSGPAGGSLTGTYPNPTIITGSAVSAGVASSAANAVDLATCETLANDLKAKYNQLVGQFNILLTVLQTKRMPT